MGKYKDAVALLRKDELKNINFLNFMENNSITSVEIIGESILLRGTSDRDWVYISCNDKNDLKEIIDRLNEKDKCFGAIEDWMLPVITKGKDILWKLSVVQYYLPEEVELPAPKYKTMPLNVDDARTIFENSNYKDFLSVEYIKERIQLGISAGVYEENKLVAWGMTQDDGGMGFLHVLDDYRRKGYGYNVTLSLTNEIRKSNKLPFAYIEEKNVKSINMVLKLGFKKDRLVHWFETKDGH